MCKTNEKKCDNCKNCPLKKKQDEMSNADFASRFYEEFMKSARQVVRPDNNISYTPDDLYYEVMESVATNYFDLKIEEVDALGDVGIITEILNRDSGNTRNELVDVTIKSAREMYNKEFNLKLV